MVRALQAQLVVMEMMADQDPQDLQDPQAHPEMLWVKHHADLSASRDQSKVPETMVYQQTLLGAHQDLKVIEVARVNGAHKVCRDLLDHLANQDLRDLAVLKVQGELRVSMVKMVVMVPLVLQVHQDHRVQLVKLDAQEHPVLVDTRVSLDSPVLKVPRETRADVVLMVLLALGVLLVLQVLLDLKVTVVILVDKELLDFRVTMAGMEIQELKDAKDLLEVWAGQDEVEHKVPRVMLDLLETKVGLVQ